MRTDFDGGNSSVLRADVPQGSLVVLQSLDLTGGHHTYCLKTVSREGAEDSAGRRILQNSSGSRWRDGIAADTAQQELLPPGSRHCVEVGASALARSTVNTRRLLLPQFTDAGLHDVAMDCRSIFMGEAVAVYVAPELPAADTEETLSLCRALEQQLRRGNGTLRVAIETELGSIDDIDGDGRLTVVLTNLDRRRSNHVSAINRVPVLGCVREADFLGAQTETGGDLVYLAPEGLWQPGSQSLVAHELAHAAVHCRQRGRFLRGQGKLAIPEWFHEALAHVAEHSVAGPGEFYEQRLAEFQLSPQTCPVVTGFPSAWGAGRGGSRPAGLLFLQCAMQRSANLPELFERCETFDELLDGVLRQSFGESLAEWGPLAAMDILRARPQAIASLRADMEHSGVMSGTAFQCWRSETGPLTIEVHSNAAAALQLNVFTCEDELRMSRAD